MKSLLVGIKNVLLWSYARGTWQYDALCLLIIAAIFLIPSRSFGDRDRSAARANDPRETASKAGVFQWMIDLDELNGFLEKNKKEELATSPEDAIRLYLRDQLQRDVKLVKFEPLTTPTAQAGYRVWFE